MTPHELSLRGWTKLFARWSRSKDKFIRAHIVDEFLKVKHKRERQMNERAN